MRCLRLTQKGFDEFMNVVIDETIQHYQPKKDGSKAVKPSEELGRILLKGELRATMAGVCDRRSLGAIAYEGDDQGGDPMCARPGELVAGSGGFIGSAAGGTGLLSLGIDE